MRIVVLAKQVPDTRHVTGQVMREDGTLDRAALPAVYNPDDLHALEQALRLKDRHGGEWTVVTWTPARAVCGIIYRGRTMCFLTDGRFAGRSGPHYPGIAVATDHVIGVCDAAIRRTAQGDRY